MARSKQIKHSLAQEGSFPRAGVPRKTNRKFRAVVQPLPVDRCQDGIRPVRMIYEQVFLRRRKQNITKQ